MSYTTDYFQGNAGAVVDSGAILGGYAAQVHKFRVTVTRAVVDKGVLGDSDWPNNEPGRVTGVEGTLTARGKHSATPPDGQTLAVITLQSRAAKPYRQLSGTGWIKSIPFTRERGDQINDQEFAVVGTGAWTDQIISV